MNYAWEVLLKAKEQECPEEELCFEKPSSINPYMETAFEDINLQDSFPSKIPVNPFYRFGAIFNALLEESFDNCNMVREFLIDVLFHTLAQVDLLGGLSRQEYFRKFFMTDVENGRLGKQSWTLIHTFPYEKQFLLVDHMIRLYEDGTSIFLLNSLLRSLYHNSITYMDTIDRQELLIYIGKSKTTELEQQVRFILDLFVPFDYSVQLFWDMHFGIIGVDETMGIDELMIY